MELNKKSLFFGKTSLKDYTRDQSVVAAMATEVFDLIKRGVLKVNISREYPLQQVALAHRELADRKSVGSVILRP